MPTSLFGRGGGTRTLKTISQVRHGLASHRNASYAYTSMWQKARDLNPQDLMACIGFRGRPLARFGQPSMLAAGRGFEPLRPSGRHQCSRLFGCQVPATRRIIQPPPNAQPSFLFYRKYHKSSIVTHHLDNTSMF